MTSIPDRLERLKAGNRRFVNGTRKLQDLTNGARRESLRKGQEPFAVILGCSDSRVPPEVVFDQGLGDLFVIRVAGNVAGSTQIGSVEFAVESFGISLVIVLGHSNCGAVSATLEEYPGGSQQRSPNLHAIVDSIRPAMQPLSSRVGSDGTESLIAEAVVLNVEWSVNQLGRSSPYLERLVSEGDLVIVGAQYSLETGEVEFLLN